MLCVPCIAPVNIRRFNTGEMVERAREMARIDMKDFLSLMGISQSAWVRQREGRGPDHISFDRMSALPWRFWLWLIVALLAHFTSFPQVEDVVAQVVVGAVRRFVGTDRPGHVDQGVSVVQEGSTCEEASRSLLS